MKNKILIILITIITFLSANSTEIDSLYKKYEEYINNPQKIKTIANKEILKDLNKINKKLIQTNPDKALQLSRIIQKIAMENKYKRIEAVSIRNEAIGYYRKAKYDSSLYFLRKALEIFKNREEYEVIAKIYNDIGNIYRRLEDSVKSLKYYHKSLEITEMLENEKGMGKVYHNIGNIYFDQRNYKKALEYYKKSLNFEKKIGDSEGMASSYLNIGNVYHYSENSDKSVEFYKKALTEFQKIGIELGVAMVHNNLTILYSEKGEYEKALEHGRLALELHEKIGKTPSVLKTKTNIARIYFEIGKYNKAEKIFKEVLNKTKPLKMSSTRESIFKNLSAIEEKRGNKDVALNYYKKYSAIKDSIYDENKNKILAEMDAKYQVSKKQNEIEILKKEKKIQELKLKKERNLLALLITSFIFVLVVMVLLILFYKQKHSANKELRLINKKLKDSEKNLRRLNATKDKFFSIIAHDLKNPFGALVGFSELLTDQYDFYDDRQKLETIKLIHKTAKNISTLLQNLLTWSRTQTNRISFNPKRVKLSELVEMTIDAVNSQAVHKDIEIRVIAKTDCFVYVDTDMIRTVLRNLLSNSIKFSYPKSKIDVSAKVKQKEALVSVRDYGTGIDEKDKNKIFNIDKNFSKEGTENEKGTGLGLILCKEFVEKNGGKIWLETKLEKGTKFIFSLPLR